MSDDIGYFPEKRVSNDTWDGLNIVVTSRFAFQRPKSVGGQLVVVEVGTGSDGPSIPTLARLLGVDHDRRAFPGGVVHDACYRDHVFVDGLWTLLDKDTADLILFECCVANGMTEGEAREIYAGVRTPFGQAAFDNDRQQRLAAQKG